MFGKRLTLFRVLGIEVRADVSSLAIVALVTWSLAAGAFPYYYRGLSPGTYWAMGGVGALGLFASILFHELSHSLVGRRFGQEVKGITLWLFGGMAETSEEPERPRHELLMAAAGPAASLVLSGVFFGLSTLATVQAWPLTVQGVVSYLAFVNLLLAVFNLVPAFPLDGGRLLRAALWRRRGLLEATRLASNVGAAFGWMLIGLGGVSVLFGSLIGGLWWILVGSFVRQAAKAHYRQLVASRVLAGAPVRRMMRPWPDGLPPGSRLRPETPPGEPGWNQMASAERLLATLGPLQMIDVESDAAEALRRLQESGGQELVVTEEGHVAGVLTVEHLREYLLQQAGRPQDPSRAA